MLYINYISRKLEINKILKLGWFLMTQYLWIKKKKVQLTWQRPKLFESSAPITIQNDYVSLSNTFFKKKKKSGWLLKSNRMVHLHRWEENKTEKNI